MRKFRTLIRGQNFQMRNMEADGIQTYGFYTTVFVESESPESAEYAAIDALRQSPKLRDTVTNPADDPPRMFVEELQEIADWPPDTKRPLTGFTFFLYTGNEAQSPNA